MTALRRPGDSFERALDEVGRRPRPKPNGDGAPLPAPGFGARFDFGPTPGGGEARWGLAMDWADQPSLRPHAPRAVDPVPHGDLTKSDLAEAVARELGFGACRTADALARRWRAYVWRNHPDRQPQHGRERANARVAVANALYDSARRALRRV